MPVNVLSPKSQEAVVPVAGAGLGCDEGCRALGLYRQLFSALGLSSQGITIIDPGQADFPVIYCNQAFLNLVGRAQDKVVEQGFLSLLDPADREEAREVVKQAAAELGPATREFRLACAGGETLWDEVTLSPVLNEAGTGYVIVALHRDVSERRQSVQARERAQRMEALGALAGGMAHEFNNALSIILGYVHLAMKDAQSQPSLAANLAKVLAAGERAAGLTQQLLTLSRKQVVREEVVDLCQLARDNDVLAPLFGERYRYETDVPETPITVRADRNQLVQSWLNLAINARDAMPDGGTIRFSIDKLEAGAPGLPPAAAEVMAKADGGNCGAVARISIADDGEGIAPEIRERLFEPFFTTKEPGKGTGLGLAMVYGAVVHAGGMIDVESEPGQGSSFHIYLPMVNELPARRDDTARTTGNFSGKTILVAEDEPELLDVLTTFLREDGWQVLCAADGVEALKVQDEFEGKIDVVLTDVVMPELGGVEAADLIADVRPETPVIFTTGYPDRGGERFAGVPAGACVLMKPVDFTELRRVLSEVTGAEAAAQ